MALLTCIESYSLMLQFKNNRIDTVEESIADLRSIIGMKSNMRNGSTIGINTTKVWRAALFQKSVLKMLQLLILSHILCHKWHSGSSSKRIPLTAKKDGIL